VLGLYPDSSGTAPEDNMSVAPRAGNGKVTVPDIVSRKSRLPSGSLAEPRITCLTAYDYPTARLLDEAEVDILLVGDSLAMVVLGYENTLPVTMEEMLHHTRAVRRGAKRALLVADMPYGSFHTSVAESVANAVRFVKEAGAEAVKVEGGERRLELIARLVEAEIPVMAHIGLTPQSLHALGGFRVQGKTADAAEQLLRDARAIEAAGAFCVVLESIPRELAARISRELRIPTIGIGAGPDCDGQILVFHDMVGLTSGHTPKFARRYANLGETIAAAVGEYCADVRAGRFPSDAESYHLPAEVRPADRRVRDTKPV
jgi:3-methyl-2-oxobutanoate hydroxymethyltransferase